MTNQLIKLSEITQLTNRSRAMIYKDICAGLFPRPIYLGGDNTRGSYFPANEVNAIILARGAGYDDNQIKKLVTTLKEQRKDRFQQLLSAIS
ncbi:MAG: AlpA family phage regulatory protein [Alteromonadaceae bacterium]|nr:AlpA family phage regulatory protein [Alteromonadaceae bacterium]